MDEKDKEIQELRRENEKLRKIVDELEYSGFLVGPRLETIKTALKVYGNTQIVVAMEEMAELTKELSKALRGQGNREHIKEEMVDVTIMLAQMQEEFQISPLELSAEVDKKVDRLKERLSRRLWDEY